MVNRLDIATLQRHCRSLLSPLNTFLVANSHAVFGELPEVVDVLRSVRGG
jgi:hypothetical protein